MLNQELKSYRGGQNRNKNQVLNTPYNEIIVDNYMSNFNFDNKNTKKNNFDLSCSFSIKGENEIQLLDAATNANLESNTENYEKVLVYNIGVDFLIPMLVKPLKDNDNSNLIKLQYVDKKHEMVLNKNDLFLQKTASFDSFGNLSDLKIINELSVLRSIMLNFKEGKYYILINNIFLRFVLNDNNPIRRNPLGIGLQNTNYTEEMFIQIDNEEYKFFIVKNIFSNPDLKSVFQKLMFNSLENKNKNFSSEVFETIFDSVFQLLSQIGNRVFLQLIFPSTGEMKVIFNLVPFFSVNAINNYFTNKSLFFAKEDTNKKKFIKISSKIEKEIKSCFNSSTFINNNSLIPICQNFCNFNGELITLIYNLLEKMNLLLIFRDVFHLLFMSYLIYHNKRYYNSVIPPSQNNLILYSNFVIFISLKYIFDVISLQLTSNSHSKSDTLGNVEEISYLFLDQNLQSEDFDLLNEVILGRCSENKLAKNMSLNYISNFLQKNFNDNYKAFHGNLSTIEKKIISHFEEMFNLSFIMKFYNMKKKFIDLVYSNLLISFQIFENYEISSNKIKQIWFNEVNAYDEAFFSQDELIIEFLQNNKILEYAKLSQGTYFCELSYKNFFKFFLPILSDIDVKYDPRKNYSKKIHAFINDLHNYQKIKENFNIDETRHLIQIGFQTFDIMIQLIKNVKEEKIVLIQKNIKMFLRRLTIRTLRALTIKIQKNYRNHLYRKIIKMTDDEISLYIINRYKSKDPILLKFIIEMKKRNNGLILENQLLRKQIAKKKNHMMGMKGNAQSSNFPSLNISNNSFRYLNTTSQLNKGKQKENLTTRTNRNVRNSNGLSLLNKSNKSEMTQYSKDSVTDTSSLQKEIKVLKEKLEASRSKYKNLVTAASEYERKMDVFLKLINSKEEIKEILAKNGVHFN